MRAFLLYINLIMLFLFALIYRRLTQCMPMQAVAEPTMSRPAAGQHQGVRHYRHLDEERVQTGRLTDRRRRLNQ